MGRIQSSVGLITGIPIQDTVDQLIKLAAKPRDLLTSIATIALISAAQAHRETSKLAKFSLVLSPAANSGLRNVVMGTDDSSVRPGSSTEGLSHPSARRAARPGPGTVVTKQT